MGCKDYIYTGCLENLENYGFRYYRFGLFGKAIDFDKGIALHLSVYEGNKITLWEGLEFSEIKEISMDEELIQDLIKAGLVEIKENNNG